MRKKEMSGGLSVQAIAGTHVVLLGMNLPLEKCTGLLGFALRREDHTEGEKYWLSGYKTFESVEPHPAKGVLYSTRKHPIQGFTWSDFSAKPGTRLQLRSHCLARQAGESPGSRDGDSGS